MTFNAYLLDPKIITLKSEEKFMVYDEIREIVIESSILTNGRKRIGIEEFKRQVRDLVNDILKTYYLNVQ